MKLFWVESRDETTDTHFEDRENERETSTMVNGQKVKLGHRLHNIWLTLLRFKPQLFSSSFFLFTNFTAWWRLRNFPQKWSNNEPRLLCSCVEASLFAKFYCDLQRLWFERKENRFGEDITIFFRGFRENRKLVLGLKLIVLASFQKQPVQRLM